MKENITEIHGLIIHYGQLILVPVFGIMFIIGLILYLSAFKNPHRKRKSFLFTIVGAVGFLLFIYAPVILVYYFFDGHPANTEAAVVANQVESIGWTVYSKLLLILKPITFFLFYLGIGIWLLAAKNPPRRRIGMGLVCGCPSLYGFFLISPKIYHFFTQG